MAKQRKLIRFFQPLGTRDDCNALFIGIALLLALAFWLMHELKFLVPHKAFLIHEYGQTILIYVAVLFVNLLAATLALIRKFFLKDTGRKLLHLDRQLHLGEIEVPPDGLKRRMTEMARGYEPGEFIDPREVPERRTPKDQQSSRMDDPRHQEQRERAQEASSRTTPEESRSPGSRSIYEIRGRTYRLRTSEITAMVEIGKFRAIAMEDLRHFAYGDDGGRMRPDVENLVRQGLIQMKSIPDEEKGSRTLLSLTHPGHRFLKEHGFAGKDQALYHGFAKPREAHHDADLYRLYQKAAEKIEQAGGRNLRVILDYELKKRVYHDLAKLGPDRVPADAKRNVAEKHGLQVVRGKIPLPDVRIEYETSDGTRTRVDLELATSHYRGRTLAEKVRAGFSIYAHASDVSNLRRVLDQRELTAEILSL